MNPQEQELAKFIEIILGNDNSLRNQNEALLNQMVLSQPNDFIFCLISLLSSKNSFFSHFFLFLFFFLSESEFLVYTCYKKCLNSNKTNSFIFCLFVIFK